jgi:tripartite-type tricarboxylate transporter receptor subunit TctC
MSLRRAVLFHLTAAKHKKIIGLDRGKANGGKRESMLARALRYGVQTKSDKNRHPCHRSEETLMRCAALRYLVAPLFLMLGVAANAAPGYPAKAVTIVVPYPPGGPTDIVARVVGQKLAERIGQAVVIDNRPGAGGNVGASLVAKAAPDGYTLLLGTTAHAINPSIFANLNYDIVKDFSPVVLLTSLPLAVVVNPSLPAKNIQELIALAKSSPAPIAYASSGNGQSTHLAAELFKSMAGVPMTHVPYKGSAPALTDLVAGQVSVMFDTMLSSMPQVKSGRLRALAVTSATRSGAAPNLPTVAESGVPGYEAVAWSGLLAPANTPPEIVAKLNSEINQILKQPEVRKRFLDDGADPVGGTAEQFSAHIKSEVKKWGEVAKASGARVD